MFIYRNFHIRIVVAWLVSLLVHWNTSLEAPGWNLGQHTNIFQSFSLVFGYFRFYAYFFPFNWFFSLNIYRKKIIKKRYELLIVKCFEHIFEPSSNELAGGVGGSGHSRTMHYVFTQISMRGDYRHNKTSILCNYRKHFIMTHCILSFYLVLHYACQIRYTALCNWIRHFVLTLRISISYFIMLT